MNRIPIPFFDIHETPSHFMVSLSLTGKIGERVEIELTDDEFLITGKGQISAEAQPSVSLKINSESRALAAHYQDGFLTIALPKTLTRGPTSQRRLSPCH